MKKSVGNTSISIFDSTLRDGAQAEGISFSVDDKLKITRALDELGVAYIEAGNPGSNPKDLEFFQRIKGMQLQHSVLTAFGSTRRPGVETSEDDNIKNLVMAETPAIAIFGKSWDFHVTEIINTTLEENLDMIRDTMTYFKSLKKDVVYDAEHFFDGYKNNPEYAMATLQAAKDGGADWIVLCDTNGGAFPQEIFDATARVLQEIGGKVGIHCHNDGGMAVANTIMAVEAGATQVQGTYIGFGERCGNVNLCSVISNLQLKKKMSCLPEDKLKEVTPTARYIAEVANVSLNEREPFIGNSAFAHKGGMHIDGVHKNVMSFEHVDPEKIGNKRRFLMSEVAGRSTILKKIRKVNPAIRKDSEETRQIIDKLKELEHQGYQFEGAESSFELVIRKTLGKYKPFFSLDYYKIMDEQLPDGTHASSAILKIQVDGKDEVTVAEGNGPVNAMDKALRKALETFYPELKEVYLADYKVRVLDTRAATASKVRVLIESSDGRYVWSTVGVSSDIIQASWLALVDSIEYKLLKNIEEKASAYM